MSGKVVGWAFDVGRESDMHPSRRYVLVAYADNADHNGKCWPEKTEIVEKTGLSRATVYRAIEDLEGRELLAFTEDGKGRECVRLRVPWASHGETTDSQSETFASHGETTKSQPEKGTNKEPSVEPSENQTAGDLVRQIFELWQAETGRPRAQLTAGRRRVVEARLRDGYEPALIEQAIRNVANSPFHQGKNDGGRRHDDLTLICRNGEKLEGYSELVVPAGGGPVSQPVDLELVKGGLASALAAWPSVVVKLQHTVSGSTLDLWIRPLEPVGADEESIFLSAPTGICSWVDRRYSALIREALEAVDFKREVVFVPTADESQAA